MAAIGMMVDGAIVNAFAFSGSNFLFFILRNKDIEEEPKRHDLAVEQLQKTRDEWYEKRTERLYFINETLRNQDRAISTFKAMDNTLYEYSLIIGQNLQSLEKESQLYVLINQYITTCTIPNCYICSSNVSR